MADDNATTQLHGLATYARYHRVEDMISEFLGDQGDGYDVEGIAHDWREALNAELEGTTIVLLGDNFYAAYPEPDDSTELIQAAIQAVDVADFLDANEAQPDPAAAPTTFAVGDSLGQATDDQVRALIREYGWDSPWFGDDESDTLEYEVRNRVPALAASYRAMVESDKADLVVARETNPRSIMMLTYQSERTKTATVDYQAALARWLDGTL